MLSITSLLLRLQEDRLALEIEKSNLSLATASKETEIQALSSRIEEARRSLRLIDPILIGENRSHRMQSILRYKDTAYFSVKRCFISYTKTIRPLEIRMQQDLALLQTHQQEKLTLSSRLSATLESIRRFDEEKLSLEAQLKEQHAKEKTTRLLFDKLHLARLQSIDLMSSRQLVREEEEALAPQADQKEDLVHRPEAPLPASKTMHEQFLDNFRETLQMLGLSPDYSLSLIIHLFPKVTHFLITPEGNYHITFEKVCKLDGNLCGRAATIFNDSSLSVSIDKAKKMVLFQKEGFKASTGFGQGYLSSLTIIKTNVISIDSYLKKGFYIPISANYNHEEFKEAFLNTHWIPV
jgi:hypothetical protein